MDFTATEASRTSAKKRSQISAPVGESHAVVFQLIQLQTQSLPFKLLQLVDEEADDNIKACAQRLLQEPRCMRDCWSHDFLTRYDSTEALASLEARLVLTLVAEKLQLTTYTTERLHSPLTSEEQRVGS